MEVSAKHKGQTLTFFLVGELDHHGAKGLLENLEREIERTLPLSLVLDFSGVTFMDSSGIGVIMGRYKNIHFLGGTMAVEHVNPRMERMLRMAGVYRLMESREGE